MTEGKVIAHATMSLDGFIADAADGVEWIFDHLGVHDEPVKEFMGTVGAMLGGRRSFDVGARDDRGAYEGAWSGPMFVLTHEPPPESSASSPTFLSGDVRVAVATALDAAGGKNLEVVGGSVIRQCLAAGVVDEIVVHVLPVLLGDGVPLFERGAFGRIGLDKIGADESGAVTTLRFGVSP